MGLPVGLTRKEIFGFDWEKSNWLKIWSNWEMIVLKRDDPAWWFVCGVLSWGDREKDWSLIRYQVFGLEMKFKGWGDLLDLRII